MDLTKGNDQTPALIRPKLRQFFLVFLAVRTVKKRIELHIGVARGGRGTGPPTIELLPMIKISQKILWFLQFQFLLASSLTTVHAYSSNQQ